VRVAPAREEAESQRTPPGTARTAESAMSDDVSNTDRFCRADSALSCAQTWPMASRDGSDAGWRPRASCRSAAQSARSAATSNGGVLTVAASRADVRSRLSSI
jgi:hypothetical protein